MVSYKDWNQALAKYFLSGVPLGTQIYLSADQDTLELIGQSSFSSLPVTNWNEDFRSAVIKKIVFENDVRLKCLQDIDYDGFPNCVGFLAATVLAAYQMADEERISEFNYFKRLREILGLPGSGRLSGMKSGNDAEKPLWETWNKWLWKQGYIPSAKPGNGRRQKFINYPISQCLLRQADKDRLRDFFTNKQWKTSYEAQTLLTKIRCDKNNLPDHLQELVTNSRQRYEAVAEAIHEIYHQWLILCASSPIKQDREKRNWSANLFAGLYRTEDPFFGQAEYYLYPKQQRGLKLDLVEVESKNAKEQLRQDRPGWYLPLKDSLSTKELDQGVRYSISSTSEIEKLILPARDFWILIPDPENPDSEVYASWKTPELGTKFILLCKREIRQDIELLRDERLLEWDGEPKPFDEQSTWVEIHQCMVISQAWEGVFPKNQELKDFLQPKVRLSISFSGGLRVPHQRGWLEGYPPQMTVFGFTPNAEIKVTRLLDDEIVLKRMQKTNQAQPLELQEQGTYLVRATYSSEIVERVINILSFDSLKIVEPKPEHQRGLSLGDEY